MSMGILLWRELIMGTLYRQADDWYICAPRGDH
jgi:hypothetical protein